AIMGVALGLIGSFLFTRLASSLLFGVGVTDPLTLGATVVLLAAVALLAGYIPAWRASRIEPMTALRAS
ncbi:MAG: hypothetical protein ACRD5L_08620, partial [Bryobacteraceae bacterium]